MKAEGRRTWRSGASLILAGMGLVVALDIGRSKAMAQGYAVPGWGRGASSPVVTRRGDSRGVLTNFSSRGGIGTTPFLGNTRGLGGYSTNFDAPGRGAPASTSRRWPGFGPSPRWRRGPR